MISGDRGVKWLHPESAGDDGEALLRHEGHRSKAADVAVVERAAVTQVERQGRVAALIVGHVPVVDQQGACESRLHDQTIARRQIDHDELGAPPTMADHGPRKTPRELVAPYLAQHIWPGDVDADDALPSELAIEIASDRLSLR